MTKFISKTSILFAGLFAMISLSYADDLTLEYDFKNFEKIRIDNIGIELEVSVGEDYEVIVEGHEVNVRNLQFKVSGDELVIYREDSDKTWHHRGNSGLEVEIKMPKFTGLELRGAVDADIKGVDSDRVVFDLKGAGHIEIDGKCKTLIVELKGAGKFDAEDLKCESVEVQLKGAGKMEVYASEEVDAGIYGMGSIDVFGNPNKVKKNYGWLSHISIH